MDTDTTVEEESIVSIVSIVRLVVAPRLSGEMMVMDWSWSSLSLVVELTSKVGIISSGMWFVLRFGSSEVVFGWRTVVDVPCCVSLMSIIVIHY